MLILGLLDYSGGALWHSFSFIRPQQLPWGYLTICRLRAELYYYQGGLSRGILSPGLMPVQSVCNTQYADEHRYNLNCCLVIESYRIKIENVPKIK